MYNANGQNNNGILGDFIGRPTMFNGYQYSRLPHYDFIRVNGEAGAKAFQMAPNSGTFLVDSTNPNILWMVQTDGAGYLTVTPLDVSIHQAQPAPDYSGLEKRIKHLEDMYEQFNSGLSKQSKKQRQSNSTITTVEQSTDATT